MKKILLQERVPQGALLLTVVNASPDTTQMPESLICESLDNKSFGIRAHSYQQIITCYLNKCQFKSQLIVLDQRAAFYTLFLPYLLILHP